MKIGTYYYPDQWPREQWERDFDHMAQMGMQIVHMGEFAWGTIEPAEGQYHLDWLHACVELAARRKMQVILCTPTAVLPVWMATNYPETLITNQRFGGRRHANHLHPRVQEYTYKVVTQLADRLGNHPAVIGWQIDNEYGAPFDQSPTTHKAFQKWLEKKYGSIEGLNKAWGCQFWNTFYSDFSQIQMPETRDPRYGNPHQMVDASRFWSWSFAQFNKLQTDILKPKIGDRFTTTNFMPLFMDIDPGDMYEDLSLYSWDSYPVSGWDKEPKDETFRFGNPVGICMTHDHMASYRDRWALMELQPGQINWSGVPVLLYPGVVRLWIWTALAHGAEFVTTYRFRQPRWGIELFHHGLLTTDGVTPTPGGRQFAQVAEEIKKIPNEKWTAKSSAPTVGIILDFEQLWNYESLKQAKQWDQGALLRRWYGAAARLGLNVKILQPNRPIPQDIPLVIAPGIQMVDDALISNFTHYVKSGGHLVLTCRTGLMDRNGHLWEGPTAAPILSLIGGTIEAYDSLPVGHTGEIELDNEKFPWGVWGDLLYNEPDTRVIAKYADQFYAGAVAVMQKKHEGGGWVTYCGVYSEQAFTSALLAKLAGELKLKTTVLPDRVFVKQVGAFKVLLNYQDKPVEAPAGKGARFVIGSKKVEPAGVAIWEEVDEPVVTEPEVVEEEPSAIQRVFRRGKKAKAT